MARGLDKQKQAELTAFVNELAALAGYKTSADWAREAGYPEPNLSRLRAGKSGVDGYNLLRLIQAAAERGGVDPAKAGMDLAASSTNEHLRSLQTRFDSHAEAMTKALRAVAEDVQKLRTQLGVAAPSATGRGKN